MNSDFCQYWLTCANEKEASKIANTLLVNHFIACAKQVPVKADFLWESDIQNSDEILLIMDSKPELFNKIEAEVAKLHSYDTFVLQEVQVGKISTKAKGWMENELVNG